MNPIGAARQESDAELCNVRALPLELLVAVTASELDGPLDRVLRDLPANEEKNMTAFTNSP